MYLSRIKLDTGKRKTMLAMADPALFHGAIESAFGGNQERKLWRLDKLNGEQYLLLLSIEKPDFFSLDEQFGKHEGWESREYDPLLALTQEGTSWHFRLKVNPVKSVYHKGQRGEIHAHITEKYQKQWLLERCEKHGFVVAEDGFTVTKVEHYQFHKRENPAKVSILAVTFEGILTITDQAAFNDTLINGMGRGKAYGLGLLTVVRGR